MEEHFTVIYYQWLEAAKEKQKLHVWLGSGRQKNCKHKQNIEMKSKCVNGLAKRLLRSFATLNQRNFFLEIEMDFSSPHYDANYRGEAKRKTQFLVCAHHSASVKGKEMQKACFFRVFCDLSAERDLPADSLRVHNPKKAGEKQLQLSVDTVLSLFTPRSTSALDKLHILSVLSRATRCATRIIGVGMWRNEENMLTKRHGEFEKSRASHENCVIINA